MKNPHKLIKCKFGVHAIDYGLVAASITIAIIAVVNYSGYLYAKFGGISDHLTH